LLSRRQTYAVATPSSENKSRGDDRPRGDGDKPKGNDDKPQDNTVITQSVPTDN